MNREDIIRMVESVVRTDPPINACDFGVPTEYRERAEHYAHWRVHQEREACAKAADAELGTTAMLLSMPPQSAAAFKIAAAIRARGNT